RRCRPCRRQRPRRPRRDGPDAAPRARDRAGARRRGLARGRRRAGRRRHRAAERHQRERGVPVAPRAGADAPGARAPLGALPALTVAVLGLGEAGSRLAADLAAAALKREVAGVVGGERFADVALLGAVPARGLRTPALASGEGARGFAEALEPLGMPIDVVSELPGDAAALKLLRSVFTKGVAAAAIESVRAAEAAGHAEWL